jgi:5'-nucleotidase
MASAWLRRFSIGTSIVAAATLSACASSKSKDSASEIPDIPESPPATVAAPESMDPVWTEPSPIAPVAAQPHVHVVRKGDTLFSLARQYYGGDASQWRRIYEANRTQIPDRNRIKVGQELLIPD